MDQQQLIVTHPVAIHTTPATTFKCFITSKSRPHHD